MSIRRLLTPLILGISVALTLLWALAGQPLPAAAMLNPDDSIQNSAPAAPGAAAERRVCPIGCAYASLQEAVDDAVAGDLIKVAEGIYTQGYIRGGLRQAVYVSKTLTIRGGYTTTDWTTPDPAAYPTVLDPLQDGRVVYVTGPVTLTVTGLRLTNGNAADLGGPWGAGVDGGGGMYVDGATVVAAHLVIDSNTAEIGGGVCLEDGGSLLGDGTVDVHSNTATGTWDGGGGVMAAESEGTAVTGAVIHSNHANGAGGGVHLSSGTDHTTLSANAIYSNVSDLEGGGVAMLSSSMAMLNNNVIADNDAPVGSGLAMQYSDAALQHTTIADNTGGDSTGVRLHGNSGAHATFTNTIIAGHSLGVHVETGCAGCSAALDHTLWHDNTNDHLGSVATSVDLTGDPQFVAPGAHDYHIGATSAAINEGLHTYLDNDIDGDIRPQGHAPDLGADEYTPQTRLAVTKQVSPDPVWTGERLTYTIRLTNTGDSNLIATLNDTLPSHVSPGGILTWTTDVLAPEEVWTATVVVTADLDYTGPLTNVVRAVSSVGPSDAYTCVSQAKVRTCWVRVNDRPTDYASVQAAVDAADPGDLVKVAGTCSGVETRAGLQQTAYVSKTLTLRGGYTTTNWTTSDPVAHPTTLDALGLGRVIYVTGGSISTIEGLNITGGDATGLGGGPWNYDGTGGGVYVEGAVATVKDCVIYDNVAGTEGWGGGGGIYLYSACGSQLTNNLIHDNTAGTADPSGLSGEGGGVAITEDTGQPCMGENVILERNTISNNAASSAGFGLGGGLYMEVGAPVLRRNVIRDNAASLTDMGLGGGLFNGYYGDPLLVNTVIVDNVCGPSAGSFGGGIVSEYASGRFLHTTLQNNTGGDGSGVHAYFRSDLAFTNTIVVSQTVGVTVTANSTVTLDSVLWHGNEINTGGPGAIAVTNGHHGSPAFASDGYHIQSNSAAIDEGLGVAVTGVTEDIDGQTRPEGSAPDLGADEYVPQAGLKASKDVTPDPAWAGEPLTYTIRVTNTGDFDLTAVVTDTLPGDVAPGGVTTWTTGLLAPDDVWTDTLVVTTDPAYTGPLTNVVRAVSDLGPSDVYTRVSTVAVRTCWARIDGHPTDYATLQAAVDAAGPGDLIKLAGTCTGVETRAGLQQTAYVSKSVTIRGGYTTTNWTAPDPLAHPTILDARGEGRVVAVVGAASPTLQGLHITGGDASGLGGGMGPLSADADGAGGGIYVVTATATISNCAIYSNVASRYEAGYGGGLYLHASPSTIMHNAIFSNTASSGWEGYGGGVYMEACDQAALVSNALYANTASTAAYGAGGGMDVQSSDAQLRNNLIQDNTASAVTSGNGGGLMLGQSAATLRNNVVRGNVGGSVDQGYGSGIRVAGGSPLLVNTVVVGNVGAVGGIVVEAGSPRLLHTTLHSNAGGDSSGLHIISGGTAALTNTILVSQTVGVTVTANSTATLDTVLWHHNGALVGGPGAVTVINGYHGSPAFAGDGYHLEARSAAIDRAVDAGVEDDVDGESRPYNGRSDLGADERHGPIGEPVDPREGGSLTYTDTQGLTLTVDVPPGAVVQTGTLTLNPVATPTQPFSPGIRFAGHAFDLDILFEPSPAVISVTKTAHPAQVAEPGGAVTFTVVVTNHSQAYSITLDALVDDPYGDVTDPSNPKVLGTTCQSVTIPARHCYACQFSALVSGDARETITDTLVISGTDDGSHAVVAQASASVTISDVPSEIRVTKTPAPAQLLEPGGTVTFSIQVENLSQVDAITLTSLTDDPHGDLDGRGSCSLPQQLAPEGVYTCAFTATITGNAGDSITDTVTASGTDDDGQPVSHHDGAVVTIGDVESSILVTKIAEPTQLDEPGGTVTFSVRVENQSDVDAITLTGLTDDPRGDLDGRGSCALPQQLAPRGVYTCAFSAVVSGNAGDSITDTVTASGSDDDGQPVSHRDSAVVTIVDVPSAIQVTKTATPATVAVPGGPVAFDVTIENVSAADVVTITTLIDDQHGDLDGQGSCSLPQRIAPHASYHCAFSAAVTGSVGDTFTDTVTASGTDDDGHPVSGTDRATVSITLARVYLPLVLRRQASDDGLGSLVLRPRLPSQTPPPCSHQGRCALEGGTLYPCVPKLHKPITITVHYSDADVEGIDENNLRLYYWTGTAWEDVLTACPPSASYVRDIEANILQVPVCHLSRFAYGG